MTSGRTSPEAVRYLLDTHTFIWLASAPEALSENVRLLAEDPENELMLSAASGWETALLHKLGRIELAAEPSLFVPEVIHDLDLTPVNINFDTAISAATLPLIHRDPFDRLLVATALKKKIPLLSRNSILTEYGITVIW